MIHFAALTAELYRAILARGISQTEALSLTAGVTRRVYERMAAFPTFVSRLGGRSRRRRLRRATNAFRRFPFGPPAYEMTDVESDADVVAFDVHRCPVAEYFESQELNTLCLEAWCNLDYALAERWGAQLQRSGTLAEGAERCDFRWHIVPGGESKTEGEWT